MSLWKGWGQNNFGLDLICPSSSSCVSQVIAHYQHSPEHPGGSECFSAAVKVKMHRVCSEPGHTHTLVPLQQ